MADDEHLGGNAEWLNVSLETDDLVAVAEPVLLDDEEVAIAFGVGLVATGAGSMLQNDSLAGSVRDERRP